MHLHYELSVKWGTTTQKKYYLPKLRKYIASDHSFPTFPPKAKNKNHIRQVFWLASLLLPSHRTTVDY